MTTGFPEISRTHLSFFNTPHTITNRGNTNVGKLRTRTITPMMPGASYEAGIAPDPAPDTTPVAVDTVADQLIRMRQLLHRRREIDAEYEAMKAGVQDFLGDYEVGTVDGLPAVTWTHHIRHALDQTALKNTEPHIYNAYLKASPYRRFTLIEDNT